MEQWKLVVAGAATALIGIGIGAALFGAGTARAQRTYTRCFFASQEYVDVNSSSVVATPDAAHSIDLPAGWDVVGAGGTGAYSTILLCR